MVGNQKRRLSKRCEIAAPIDCAYFNSGCYHRVRTANHSEEGMYIESDFPFKPQSTVHFRMGSGATGCNCGKMRMTGIAEVRWCEEISDSQGSLFGLGIKFYPPAY